MGMFSARYIKAPLLSESLQSYGFLFIRANKRTKKASMESLQQGPHLKFTIMKTIILVLQ